MGLCHGAGEEGGIGGKVYLEAQTGSLYLLEDRYLGLIGKWNKVYNLTAVRDPAEMLGHHLLDSLAVIAPLRRLRRD